jgi:hypothetical protein
MPPSAPAVQSLQNLVAQFSAAQAPQQQQLDTQIANNESSGSAQVSGLDQAKTNAFGNIEQTANNKGMYFSGFSPSQEASYTGATYLPALAKLQQTIAATRDSLNTSKANLNSTANTNALNEQKTEQSALDTYNQNLASEAAAERRQQESIAATASEGALNRAAAASKGPTAAEAAAAAQTGANNYLKGLTGKDGKVSPATFNAARNSWVNGGGSASTFNSMFSNYINQTHAQDYVGKAAPVMY